jgi:hypothetical protein
MNFLHLSLLAGMAAMAIPVALHLLSRRQPKLVAFPALRFVKHTVVQQRGSWQLRHFLLLCLRVGMFGAMALALARPRVHSAMVTTALGLGLVTAGAIFASLVALVAVVTRRGIGVWLPAAIIAGALWLTGIIWTGVSVTRGPVVPSSDQSAPVAAALIIDSGPTLDYRAENEKRFAVAKKMATWILSKLPIDSRVGVLTGAPIGALSLDPATAKGQVDILQPQAVRVDLSARLRTAIDLLLASDLERKEVYVITDLMKPGWSASDASLTEFLKQHADEVLVQVIDVGAENSTNWRLGDLEIDSESVPEGSNASWQVTVSRSAKTPGASATVKLLQEESGLPIISNDALKVPPSSTVDQATIDLSTSTDGQVTLTSPSLSPGSHNFRIELDVADPLQIDNTRYATVVSAAQQSALVVADDADAARLLKWALSPSSGDSPQNAPPANAASVATPGDTDNTANTNNAAEANQTNSGDATGLLDRPASAQQVRSSQLAQTVLERYGVIYVNDPPSLPPASIALLKNFVNQGGGLFLALGPTLGNIDEARQSPLNELLPGSLARVARRPVDDDSLFLVPVSTSHPLFHVFESIADDVPWNLFPLRRLWEFESLGAAAQVLMTTSDRAQPALILERRGSGQILTLVTPLPAQPGDESWNELLSESDSWPAYGLILGAARLLSGQTQSRYNFAAGENASLDNDPKLFPMNYMLFAPDGQRRNLQGDNGILLLGQLNQAGTYRMRGLQGSVTTRAVSVNTPSLDTQLDRMTGGELDDLLGAGNYRLARQQSEVESSVGQARYGRELFPVLMACVAALFLAEQAMSNRFYKLRLAPARNAA